MENNKKDFSFINDFYNLTEALKKEAVIIFSPFYPFNNNFIYKFFEKLNLKNFQLIFSNIETLNGSKNFQYNLINIMDLYYKSIEKIKTEKLYLIAFGIFSNIFINITTVFKNKIKKLILFEPDFSNNIRLKLEEKREKKISYDLNSLIYFYTDKKIKINKNLISKNYAKYFKKISLEMGNYFSDNILLKTLITNKIDTIIFWEIMEKELCPLPQILVEDYDIKAFSMNDNIYKIFTQENHKIIDILNNILN